MRRSGEAGFVEPKGEKGKGRKRLPYNVYSKRHICLMLDVIFILPFNPISL